MKYLNLSLMGVCALVFFLIQGSTTYADIEYQHKWHTLEAEPGIIRNAIRPVMEGKFERGQGKYLARLPLLANAEREAETGEDHEHENGFALNSIVEPLGITTLSLLIVTICLGVLTRKNFQLLFKWHRLLAILTLVSALCHGILVFLAH